MKFRKILISTIAALSFGASAPIAFAQDTIVIGEINRFKFFVVGILLKRDTLRTRLHGIKPVTLNYEHEAWRTFLALGIGHHPLYHR